MTDWLGRFTGDRGHDQLAFDRGQSAEGGSSAPAVVVGTFDPGADPVALGAALRQHRVARGLTQGALAQELVSIGYVSRIESGTRRPDLALLSEFALWLAVPVDDLLDASMPDRDPEGPGSEAIALELDVAELKLASGDFDGSAKHCESALPSLLDAESSANGAELKKRALVLRAATYEGAGRLEEAIADLETIVEGVSPDAVAIKAAISLSRCYRESGDLTRAIRVCEPMLAEADRLGLAGTDDGVQLAVTVAAAYYESGDVDYAVRQCRRALERAELAGSSQGRAAAYWNASVMESKRGDVSRALSFAQRAVVLLQVDAAPGTWPGSSRNWA